MRGGGMVGRYEVLVKGSLSLPRDEWCLFALVGDVAILVSSQLAPLVKTATSNALFNFEQKTLWKRVAS